jgi:hypothetical protein
LNWLEIDRILYGIIDRHDAVEDMYKEAKIQFKWNQSQAEAAIKPLLKRNTSTKNTKKPARTTEKKSKKLLNKK